MLRAGASRQQLARTLNAAYGDGLLSENTLAHRLDVLFGNCLIDPTRLVGDLAIRAPRRCWTTAAARAATVARKIRFGAPDCGYEVLLALDWTGGQDELVVGRHPGCDIVLGGAAVSRRHARLTFRDGTWVLQDLKSKNGTAVNGVRVGRCQLRPGDHLVIAGTRVRID